MSRSAIAVMARAPSAPGKTRLAPHHSESRLQALRAALLADTLLVINEWAREAADPDVDPFLVFTPEDAEPEMALVAAGTFQLVRQQGADLGERMQSVFEELLGRRGYGSAILVGSDLPLLSADHISDARDTLAAHGGVVLGPADDGGYYLIGMRAAHAGLFDAIEWGTSRVLSGTLRNAERRGVEVHLIRSAFDLDTIEDLQRLERDLETAPPQLAPNVRAWMLGKRLRPR